PVTHRPLHSSPTRRSSDLNRIPLQVGSYARSNCPFEPRPGAWHRDVAPRDGSDLLRRCVVRRAVAQVREHVGDVRELLLEVALESLQPLDQLRAARKAAAEEHPGATPPSMVTVVHFHLLSSYRARKRAVRSCERRSASAQWSSSRSPAGVIA